MNYTGCSNKLGTTSTFHRAQGDDSFQSYFGTFIDLFAFTLNEFEIYDSGIGDDCIQAIGKFSNIQELKLYEVLYLTAARMSIFRQLNCIRVFYVGAWKLETDFHESIMELDKWNSLKHFDLLISE